MPITTTTTTMTRTTTKTSKVTFWSLPREIRDMIWNELLIPEDDIFAANISCNCRCDVRSIQEHVRERNEPLFKNSSRTFGRSEEIVYNSLYLSCQPPLLAHICYESREYARRRYESAYRKMHASVDFCGHPEGAKLFAKMEGRLQWLSRKVVRYMCFDPPEDDTDDNNISHAPSEESSNLEAPLRQDHGQELPLMNNVNSEMDFGENRLAALLRKNLRILKKTPLGEDDVLLLECDQAMSASKSVRLAILDLLTKAKDYQIKVVCAFPGCHAVPVAGVTLDLWGLLSHRAPGCDFDKYEYGDANRFIETRDLFDFFGFQVLSKSFIKFAFGLSEADERIEENVSNTEQQKPLIAEYLEPFETLWAEGVKDMKSSRYGRMPKLGTVVEIYMSD